MPTDRTTLTLSDLTRRATAIVDPEGVDEAVSALAVRHEDDDVPVRSILDDLEERLGFGADGEPAVVMAQAVILYWRTVSTRLTTTRTRSCGWP